MLLLLITLLLVSILLLLILLLFNSNEKITIIVSAIVVLLGLFVFVLGKIETNNQKNIKQWIINNYKGTIPLNGEIIIKTKYCFNDGFVSVEFNENNCSLNNFH